VKSPGDFTHWQRTIADLAGKENIAPTHLTEALQYQLKLGMI
jgi:predicted ATPase with chaperone activity